MSVEINDMNNLYFLLTTNYISNFIFLSEAIENRLNYPPFERSGIENARKSSFKNDFRKNTTQ